MKLKRLSLVALLAGLGLTTMVACSGGEAGSSLAEEVLSKVILTQDGNTVSADFALPKSVTYESKAYDVTWSSSDETLIKVVSDSNSCTADVHRAFGDESASSSVTLTASVTAEDNTANADYKVKVQNIKLENALAEAINGLGIKGSYTADATVALPATVNEYKDAVNLTYKLQAEYSTSKIENNQLKITVGSGVETVKLDVTASFGSTSKSQTFEIAVGALQLAFADPMFKSPKEAAEVADNEFTWFYGYFNRLNTNGENYGNMFLDDGEGNEIYIYGMYHGDVDTNYADGKWNGTGATKYGDWDAADKFTEGDFIVGFGQVTTYNGAKQIKNAIQYQPLSVGDANKVDPKAGEVIIVEGTVQKILNATYGNMNIEDADGNVIQIYGIYQSKDGGVPEGYNGTDDWRKANTDKLVSYPAWDFKLQPGDQVVVMGLREDYGTTTEVKNCLLFFAFTAGTTEEPEVPKDPVNITDKVTIKDGKVDIPYSAITSDGEYFINLDANNKVTIEWKGFVDKSANQEVGIAAKGYVKFTVTGDDFVIYTLLAHLYGTYDNMKCYKGSDATGTLILGSSESDGNKGTNYVYGIGDTKNVFFSNPSNYEVDPYSISFTYGKPGEGPDLTPKYLEAFSGVVTDSGFKDPTDSDKTLRCYALVQNAEYVAKLVYMEVDTTNLDADGIAAAKTAWTAKFTAGKNVTLAKGLGSTYGGVQQYVIVDLADVTVGEDGTMPDFFDITDDVKDGTDPSDHVGILVKVTGTLVKDGSAWLIEVAEGKRITLYFDRAYYAGSYDDLTEGHEYEIKGFLNKYNSTVQITPIDENYATDLGGDDPVVEPDYVVNSQEVVFKDLGCEDAEDLAWIQIKDGDLKLSQGTGSNGPKYYVTGTALRLYGGNSLTVTSEKNIIAIEFVSLSSHPMSSRKYNLSSGAVATVGDITYWTGDPVKTVKLSDNASSGHAKIVSFKVYYEGDEWSVPTPSEDPDLVTFTGVVTLSAAKKTNFFAVVQNGETNEAKYIYFASAVDDTTKAAWNAKFTVGNSVTVKGKPNVFNELNQFVITTLDNVETTGSDVAVPDHLDITEKVQNGDDLTSLQSMLVKVSGVYTTSSTIKVSEDKEIAIYFESVLYSATLEVGAEYTISGFLNWYNKPQVTPMSANDVVKTKDAPVDNDALVSGTFVKNADFPEGFTYVDTTKDDASATPAWYGSNGNGINFKTVGHAIKTPTFEAQSKVKVTITINALNAKSNDPAASKAPFTVYGYNAAGEQVATGTITFTAAGEYSVVLEGTAIVSVKLVMTDYASNAEGKDCNINFGKLVVSKVTE